MEGGGPQLAAKYREGNNPLRFDQNNGNAHPVLQTAINNGTATTANAIFPTGMNPRTGQSYQEAATHCLSYCQRVAGVEIIKKVTQSKYVRKGKKQYLSAMQTNLVAVCILCTAYGWDENFQSTDASLWSRCLALNDEQVAADILYWNAFTSLLLEWVLYKLGFHESIKFRTIMNVDYQSFIRHYGRSAKLTAKPVWSNQWAKEKTRFRPMDKTKCDGHLLDLLLLLDQVIDISDRIPTDTNHYLVLPDQNLNQQLADNIVRRLY
jgi:hypothetical protein